MEFPEASRALGNGKAIHPSSLSETSTKAGFQGFCFWQFGGPDPVYSLYVYFIIKIILKNLHIWQYFRIGIGIWGKMVRLC